MADTQSATAASDDLAALDQAVDLLAKHPASAQVLLLTAILAELRTLTALLQRWERLGSPPARSEGTGGTEDTNG